MSTIQPAPAPQGAEVHTIHRDLVRQYTSAHTAGYLLIMNRCADEPLEDLIAMRDALAPRGGTGILTPQQRGSYRGQVDALDELIDQKNEARLAPG